VPVTVPTCAATSKGPAVLVARLAVALTSDARKRRPGGGWSATVPTTMPAGAPTTAAGADGAHNGASGGTRAGYDKGRVGRRVGARNVCGACGVANGCDGTHDALTTAELVEMAVAKAVGATPAAVEATVMTSTVGGVTMSKSAGRSRSTPGQEIRAGSGLGSEPDRATSPRLDLSCWAVGLASY
jgi:hypothetical protein